MTQLCPLFAAGVLCRRGVDTDRAQLQCSRGLHRWCPGELAFSRFLRQRIPPQNHSSCSQVITAAKLTITAACHQHRARCTIPQQLPSAPSPCCAFPLGEGWVPWQPPQQCWACKCISPCRQAAGFMPACLLFDAKLHRIESTLHT